MLLTTCVGILRLASFIYGDALVVEDCKKSSRYQGTMENKNKMSVSVAPGYKSDHI